jgi:hypothetical protein
MHTFCRNNLDFLCHDSSENAQEIGSYRIMPGDQQPSTASKEEAATATKHQNGPILALAEGRKNLKLHAGSGSVTRALLCTQGKIEFTRCDSTIIRSSGFPMKCLDMLGLLANKHRDMAM